MDFTRKKYRQLIQAFRDAGYKDVTLAEYFSGLRPRRMLVLRHDVDLHPARSLALARLEAEAGVRSSYYFRAVPESWDEAVIREIASLGHEVGYHYESLTTCRGDVDAAYGDFCRNLERLRALVRVDTACMHGSPRSPYDSRDIWRSYDYRSLGILGEPYLDCDFSQMLYLTDTGRCWDGFKVSVRDRIDRYQDEWIRRGWLFHRTDDLLRAQGEGRLPDALMLTTHPQRWNDAFLPWLTEYLSQRTKNLVKRLRIAHQR